MDDDEYRFIFDLIAIQINSNKLLSDPDKIYTDCDGELHRQNL